MISSLDNFSRSFGQKNDLKGFLVKDDGMMDQGLESDERTKMKARVDRK